MEKKNQKLFIIVGVLLLFGGVSLAYFVSKILTNGNGGNTSVTTAVINGATVNVEGVLSFEDLDILPGHKSVSSIKVTATGNNELIPYNLIWQGTNTLTTPLNFTIYKTSERIEVKATCEDKSKMMGASKAIYEECNISNIDKLGTEIATGVINKNETKVTLAKDEFITATSTGDIKYYYVILEYPNLDEPQNYDLEGVIEGEVTVEESNIKPDINILAAYVVQEDGTYKEVEDIPQEGYTINQDKSTCSNGTIPGWDMDNHRFYTDNLTKSGTSCYLYFYKPSADATISKLNINRDYIKSGSPDFAKIATGAETVADNGIYKTADPMYNGESYYWRGAATSNHVIFANKCWRIIRINGDGSLRLIYNGGLGLENTCTGNGSNSGSIAVASQTYNVSKNRSEYVGYTYTSGKQRPTNNVSGTASNIKTQIENWFNNNLTVIDLAKITNGKFCNDRNVVSGNIWGTTQNSTFYYAARGRLETNKTPTLSCSEEDIYTLKAGAITADEITFAGGVYGTANQSYYLYNGQYYWTISPYFWYYDGSSNCYSSTFRMNNDGSLSWNNVSGTNGVRPVINLKFSIKISGGDGTQNSPFVVAD